MRVIATRGKHSRARSAPDARFATFPITRTMPPARSHSRLAVWAPPATASATTRWRGCWHRRYRNPTRAVTARRSRGWNCPIAATRRPCSRLQITAPSRAEQPRIGSARRSCLWAEAAAARRRRGAEPSARGSRRYLCSHADRHRCADCCSYAQDGARDGQRAVRRAGRRLLARSLSANSRARADCRSSGRSGRPTTGELADERVVLCVARMGPSCVSAFWRSSSAGVRAGRRRRGMHHPRPGMRLVANLIVSSATSGREKR
jgi:hypothetical protein